VKAVRIAALVVAQASLILAQAWIPVRAQEPVLRGGLTAVRQSRYPYEHVRTVVSGELEAVIRTIWREELGERMLVIEADIDDELILEVGYCSYTNLLPFMCSVLADFGYELVSRGSTDTVRPFPLFSSESDEHCEGDPNIPGRE